MKLRIRGNSLRLRISRSEVASLLKRDHLEETIYFASQANAKLTYALEQTASMSMLTIQYTQNKVTVLIPADQANTWCISDQVGIVESLSIGSFGFLDVLIEKILPVLIGTTKRMRILFKIPMRGRRVSRSELIAITVFRRISVDLSTTVSVNRQLLMTQFMTSPYIKDLCGVCDGMQHA